LILLFSSLNNAAWECPFPGTEECIFDLQGHQQIAHLQAFTAIGCSLIGGGLYLALRRR